MITLCVGYVFSLWVGYVFTLCVGYVFSLCVGYVFTLCVGYVFILCVGYIVTLCVWGICSPCVWGICSPCVSDVRHSRQAVSCEQHYTWANLGFIRSAALCAPMQRALSSEPWVQLCLRLTATEHTPSGASNLPRQVGCTCVQLAVSPF